jgi:hypothetical protein
MVGTYVSSINISYGVLLEAYLLEVFGSCIWHVVELHIVTYPATHKSGCTTFNPSLRLLSLTDTFLKFKDA